LEAAPAKKAITSFNMPGLPKAKLLVLKQAFINDAMSPGDAARKAGVTYATASRYYEKWGEEIKKAREQQLIPQFEESLKKLGKGPKPRRQTR
jgi:hypothetical protein